MGWWKTGHKDDTIGDEPADIITDALKAIASAREQEGKPKLTLEELLAVAQAALGNEAEEIIDEGSGIRIRRLIAEVAPGGEKVAGASPAKADERLVKIFRDAFESIAMEYEDSEIGRKPRLTELLAAIAFVLGYKPEMYLSIDEGSSVKEVTAEAGGD